MLIAIQKLKEKAAKIAAHILQVDASRLAFESGRYYLPAAAAATIPISEPAVAVGEATAGTIPQHPTERRTHPNNTEIPMTAPPSKDIPSASTPGVATTY